MCAHLVCIWNAAKVLRFETLNRARLVRQARAFRDGGADAIADVDDAGEAEGVFRARFFSDDPVLGASLPDAARDWAHLERLVGHARAMPAREEMERFGGVFGFGQTSDEGSRSGGIRGTAGAPRCSSTPDATARDVFAAALAGVHASRGVRGGDDAEGFGRAYAWGDSRVDEFIGGDGCERVARGFRAAGDGESVQARVAARYRIGRRGSGGGGTRGGKEGGVGVDASVDDVLAT